MTAHDDDRRQFLRLAARAVAVTAFALPLAACGKKNAPKPPSGDKAPYPRKYPAPD